MINRYFNNRPVVTAIELFSAGFCNLNCSYCYIPKVSFINEIHKEILNKIENGTFLEETKKIIGEDLTDIAHWGTEPTLTIRKFAKFYSEAIKVFPKLETISFSSNFMTNPENLIDFIMEDLPTSKPLNIKIQVSIDGPDWITDKNRGFGITNTIIKNVFNVTKAISNNLTHKINMYVKPTIGADDILTLSDINKLSEYYKFFDDFFTEFISYNKDNRIKISTSCDPTVVMPYKYSTDDGLNFGKLTRNQYTLQKEHYKSINKPESNYYSRFTERMKSFKELFTKQRMFTCASGDTQIALSEKDDLITACHRPFYTTHPNYDSAAHEHGLDELILEGIDCGRSASMTKENVVQINDKLETLKFLYSERCYHDFSKHKYSVGVATSLELASCGQISKVFQNESLAFLLTLLIQTMDCPMDNIITVGSSLIPPIYYYKLFGNGAAQTIFSKLRG